MIAIISRIIVIISRTIAIISRILAIISTIIDDETTRCCKAERVYLSRINSDCFAPIGCWARTENEAFIITGYAASLDGSHKLIKTVQGNIEEAKQLALKLADIMIQNGARELISK